MNDRNAVYEAQPWSSDRHSLIDIVLVGCGGTGGEVADALGRMAWRERELGRSIWRLTFC